MARGGNRARDLGGGAGGTVVPRGARRDTRVTPSGPSRRREARQGQVFVANGEEERENRPCGPVSEAGFVRRCADLSSGAVWVCPGEALLAGGQEPWDAAPMTLSGSLGTLPPPPLSC